MIAETLHALTYLRHHVVDTAIIDQQNFPGTRIIRQRLMRTFEHGHDISCSLHMGMTSDRLGIDSCMMQDIDQDIDELR